MNPLLMPPRQPAWRLSSSAHAAFILEGCQHLVLQPTQPSCQNAWMPAVHLHLGPDPALERVDIALYGTTVCHFGYLSLGAACASLYSLHWRLAAQHLCAALLHSIDSSPKRLPTVVFELCELPNLVHNAPGYYRQPDQRCRSSPITSPATRWTSWLAVPHRTLTPPCIGPARLGGAS